VLRLGNFDVPAPRAGEVRIVLTALGLNCAEAMFRAGPNTWNNLRCGDGWVTKLQAR
jgi:NADPH:quinone reductase-like Zn-dependent oxidoreductase